MATGKVPQDTMAGIDVSELEGVTAEIAAALLAHGIQTTTQLLAATGRPLARVRLAEILGLDLNVLFEVTKRADLLRIDGLTVADVHCLGLAGVDSVTELGRRIPENLYVKLLRVATREHRQQPPRLDEVKRWVKQAKQLHRVVYC